MATSRAWHCAGCGIQHPTELLYEALMAVARGHAQACPNCHRPQRLHLRFAFGLGAGGKDQVVEAAFVPRTPELWDLGVGRM